MLQGKDDHHIKHVAHSYIQTNVAPPTTVFPLLCPVRETEWVPGWKYRLIHSKSGLAELGCVFATPNPDGSDTTWIVTDYDPLRRIAFTWLWPGMIATRLIIELQPKGDSQTSAHISYEYTALSERGESELDLYDKTWFASKMTGWEIAINHYLETGRKLSEAAAG